MSLCRAWLIFSSSARVLGRRAFEKTGNGKTMEGKITFSFELEKVSPVMVCLSLATVPISPAEISETET